MNIHFIISVCNYFFFFDKCEKITWDLNTGPQDRLHIKRSIPLVKKALNEFIEINYSMELCSSVYRIRILS